MPSIGAPELVIILIIVVVVFGSTKLPQLGDGLGRAIKNFKRAINTGTELDVSAKKELKGDEVAPDVEKPADKSTQAK